MSFFIEISTQSRTIPTRFPGIDNPNTETLLANGWRFADPASMPPVQDGYTRSPITWADAGDGVNAVALYTDRLQSEIEAEAAQARILDFQSKGLHMKAAKFRQLLQAFFGPGAEDNHDITADYVTYYFMTATGLSGDQVRDGIFLKELFAELAEWNGGETWTLPWGVVP